MAPDPGFTAGAVAGPDLYERAAVDRAIMKKFIDDRRNREALLNKAKAEAEAIRMANQ